MGRPINVGTGTKLETYPLFSLPGDMGLSFTLYYNSAIKNPEAPSNPVWSTNLQYLLSPAHCAVDKQDVLVCHALIYVRPDGSEILFTGGLPGPLTEVGGDGLTTLSYSSVSATYTLHDEDATTKVFDADGTLKSITDPSGIRWTLTTSGSTTTVTHSSGRSYAITFGATVNGVTPMTVTDPAGNVYTLQMGGSLGSNILSITYPGTPATQVSFQYSPTVPDLLTEVDYNGVPYDYTSYDTTSGDPHYRWATGNYFADHSESVAIQYGTDAAGNVQATVTNALGHSRVQTYDGTNGPGGAYNGQLSQLSHDAVTTCGGTTQSTSYDVNGNPSQAVDNNGNVHTYTYAANGQLQSETEASGTSLARTTNYVWDPNIQLNRLLSVTVVGWSKTAYTYNAQNRLASVAVTNLSGTGIANQTLTTTYGYTLYADGMVQTATVIHPSPSSSDTDTYHYDALGNLTSMANGLGQVTTYSNYNGLGEVGRVVGPNGDTTDVTYDARGRAQTKTTYPNGTAASWTYGYDGYGLLASELTPVGATINWTRDPEMRVTSIVRNDKDGTSTESFGYDANGDVTSHAVSRNGITSLSETLRYDALGRVYQRVGMHGQLLTYSYDGNGNVLSTTDATGHTVSSQYDALNRLTRTISSGGASPLIPSVPTVSAPATNGNGSYSVSWSSASGTTSYILQEQVNGGAWATIQSSGATSMAIGGKSNGSYGYQVRACNSSGCSAWSAVSTVVVQLVPPPLTPAALTVPATSTGNVAISWSASSTATSYTLQHRLGTGSWTSAYNGAATSYNVIETVSGSYTYQVQACNAGGCSTFKLSVAVAVTLPPASAPSLTVPASNSTGSYSVSWSAVSGATSYTLQGQVNGGSWSTIQSSSAISDAFSGKGSGSYGYRAQACNGSGCGPWSAAGNVVVTRIPATPTGLTATIEVINLSAGAALKPARTLSPMARQYAYELDASWSASTGATSYTLQYCKSGGTCATQSVSATSVTWISVTGTQYTVSVQACNTSGCSAWSAAVTPTTVMD